MSIKLKILLAILIMVGVTSNGQAATITVPDDYAKIQLAIDNANAGDTILVKSGTYTENIDVNKQITLQGLDIGSDKPLVEGNVPYSFILSVNGITLEGFKIIGTEYGLVITGSNNMVSDNSISGDNRAGMAIFGSSNTLSDNTVYGAVDGILLNGPSNILNRNIIYGAEFGVSSNAHGNNNALNDNTIKGGLGSVSLSGSGNSLSGNIIEAYTAGIKVYGNSNMLKSNILSYSDDCNICIFSGNDNIIIYNNLGGSSDVGYGDGYDLGTNQWDDGKIGNHYNSFDEPSEGCNDNEPNNICDSGFNIPGGSNVDRYPMVSWILSPSSPVFPEFPTIALPIISILGIMLLMQRKKEKKL